MLKFNTFFIDFTKKNKDVIITKYFEINCQAKKENSKNWILKKTS